VVWCGVVWCGVVWCGVVWCGVVWCGVWMLCRDVSTAQMGTHWNRHSDEQGLLGATGRTASVLLAPQRTFENSHTAVDGTRVVRRDGFCERVKESRPLVWPVQFRNRRDHVSDGGANA
jgi:hypothetical protein